MKRTLIATAAGICVLLSHPAVFAQKVDAESAKAAAKQGGCLNCHEIDKKTTSFGTIGTSLAHFGKIRGYGPEIQKYVYGKIYNAKAFNLCSKMPRFGHSETLTEDEIKDLVALLLDPNSPVNK